MQYGTKAARSGIFEVASRKRSSKLGNARQVSKQSVAIMVMTTISFGIPTSQEVRLYPTATTELMRGNQIVNAIPVCELHF